MAIKRLCEYNAEKAAKAYAKKCRKNAQKKPAIFKKKRKSK